MVAADSKPAATLALLQDWWQAWQAAERDPDQGVIVLAGRRAEVDRLNSACQQLLDAQGRLGQVRLQVEDLQLAVGDRGVCGRNAISQLGIANGTRGTTTALDPQARPSPSAWTARTPGGDPARLVSGRPQQGSATGASTWPMRHHRPSRSRLTRWRALVRMTGREDANWLYVQLSRARHQTTLYPVVGPELARSAELIYSDREPGDGYDQLAQALSHAGDHSGDRHPEQSGPAAAIHPRAAG